VASAGPTRRGAATGRPTRRGFFAPPIFFPIIGPGRAGLRVMLRANMSAEEIEQFCGLSVGRPRRV
jgi:7-keto-8-aminopelargonate synthetase-like enzyme